MNHARHAIRVVFFFVVIAPMAILPQARAVVVSGTTGNTTAPADDFGFANMGVCNGATGIYLGYRWVLGAAHVSAGNVTFNGQTYVYKTETDVVLKNPADPNLTENTDLRLFRLTETPRLPSLKIVDEPLHTGDEVVMVGNGRNRVAGLTYWDVDETSQPWIWNVTTDPDEADYSGYTTVSSKTIRWGTNQVFETGLKKRIDGVVDLFGFTTRFDQDGGPNEAQAICWDSGGGVFHKNAGRWELVGVLNDVEGFPNQPNPVYTAIYGDFTYCADLMEYRDQILDIITPLAGDANLDDRVDAADVSIMAANWGRTEDIFWMDGDFNEDGIINELDAKILAGNWGTISGGEAGQPFGAPVPEPSSFALLLAGALLLLVNRRHPS